MRKGRRAVRELGDTADRQAQAAGDAVQFGKRGSLGPEQRPAIAVASWRERTAMLPFHGNAGDRSARPAEPVEITQQWVDGGSMPGH